MKYETDRRIGAVSEMMQLLYQTAVVKKESKGKAPNLASYSPIR